MTYFPDQGRIRLLSQFIKDISRGIEKFLKNINDTVICVFIIPSGLVLSKNFDLNVNDSHSVIVVCHLSLENWY